MLQKVKARVKKSCFPLLKFSFSIGYVGAVHVLIFSTFLRKCNSALYFRVPSVSVLLFLPSVNLQLVTCQNLASQEGVVWKTISENYIAHVHHSPVEEYYGKEAAILFIKYLILLIYSNDIFACQPKSSIPSIVRERSLKYANRQKMLNSILSNDSM